MHLDASGLYSGNGIGHSHIAIIMSMDTERGLYNAPDILHRLEQLEAAGYRSLPDLLEEDDVDRFAIKTGLGGKKAQQIKDGATHYARVDAKPIEEGQKKARVAANALAAAVAAAAAEAAAANEAAASTDGNDPSHGAEG